MFVNFFDGITPQPQVAELKLLANQLSLQLAQGERVLDIPRLRLCELAKTATPWIYLADGSSLQITQASDEEFRNLSKLLPALRPGWLTYVERYTSLLVILAALLLYSVLWYHEQGVATLTDSVVKQIPESADKTLGDLVQHQMYAKRKLAESQRSDEFLDDVSEELSQFDFPIPLANVNLQFAAMYGHAANALALPNKTIIITDGMLDKLPFSNHLTREQRIQALAGIVAHEMGHLHYRHGTRGLVSFALNSLLASFLLGDVSEHLAYAGLALMRTGYSRELEQQADDYALAWLQEQGLSGEYSAVFLEEMFKQQENELGKPPRWLRWLSNHPEENQRVLNWRKVSHPEP